MSTITFTITANKGSYNGVEKQLDKPASEKRLRAEIEKYDKKYAVTKYSMKKRPNSLLGGEFDITIKLKTQVADKKKTKNTIVTRFDKENSGTFTGASITAIKVRNT